MSAVLQLPLLDAAEELAAAKATPDGAWLSPAAQALYEAEGAARFAAMHGGRNRRWEWTTAEHDTCGVSAPCGETFSRQVLMPGKENP